MSDMSTSAFRLVHGAGQHLSDADLIRDLDGELPVDGSREPAAHLRECEVCSARRTKLQARRRRLALLLEENDVASPPASAAVLVALAATRRRHHHARTGLRAAAVLLVAGALAAQPSVRGWVGRHWVHTSGSPRAAIASPATIAPSGGVLSFEPGAGPFTVRFDVHPAAGTLTIVGDSGTRAVVERIDGAEQELLVMPHGLHVRNSRGSDASYLMRVPSVVQRVTVRFGDAAAEIAVDVSVGSSQSIHFGRTDG